MEEKEEYHISLSTKILVPTLVLVGVLCYVIYHNTKEIESLRSTVEKMECDEREMMREIEAIGNLSETKDGVLCKRAGKSIYDLKVSPKKCVEKLDSINMCVAECQINVSKKRPYKVVRYRTNDWCIMGVHYIEEKLE